MGLTLDGQQEDTAEAHWVRSIFQLAGSLSKAGLDCLLHNRSTLRVAVPVSGYACPLNIKWNSEIEVVQFILRLPIAVARDGESELATLLSRVNARLVFPGFTLDSAGLHVLYRLSTPLCDRGLTGQVAHNLLQTCIQTASDYWEDFSKISTVVPSTTPIDGAPGWHDPIVSDCAVVWDSVSEQILAVFRDSGILIKTQKYWQDAEHLSLHRLLLNHHERISVTHRTDDSLKGIESRLRQLGFQQDFEEVVVERSLEERLPSPGRTLVLKRVQKPEVDLLELAVTGSRHRALRDLDAATWLKGSAADPRSAQETWRLAILDGKTVGLLRLELEDPEKAAGLGLIAMLPAWRGRGLGRTLHAQALQELSDLGYRRYRDSTDVSNLAMRKIFDSHGCRVVATLRHHRLAKA